MRIPEAVGRYKILALVGSGAMGTLLRAQDPLIDRVVAIKLLRHGLDNQEFRGRFEREAVATARLSHRNIVQIFDVGEHEGEPFIAMEFIEGETLAEWIARRLPVPVGRKLRLLGELCDGLAYAHRRGIVHRDVKPSNLIVEGGDGRLVILDFGVARLADSDATQAGTLIGSVNYMSPEQVAGSRADHRSDIFAVGAVMFELLTYQRAFPAASMSETVYRIVHGPPPSLLTALPDVDPELDQIVSRAMERDPSRRYQDLRAMAVDVARVSRRLESGEPDAAPFATPVPSPAVLTGGTGVFRRPADGQAAAGPEDARPASSPPTRAAEATLLQPPDPVPAAEPEAVPGSDGDHSVVLRPPVEPGAVPEAVLVVTESPDALSLHRRIPVTIPRLAIGRANGELGLTDRHISRQHAEIAYVADEFVVRDAGTANGTHLNGRRMATQSVEPLVFGTTIRIGATSLRFLYGCDTSLPDLTSAMVAGRYVLESRIRQSPQASVYAARDHHTQARVAVKLLSPELFRHGAYRQQFEREVETVSHLDHPHICRIVDSDPDCELRESSGAVRRLPALCYALHDGGTLQDVIDEKTPVDPERLGGWIRQLGGALQHAHEHEILHADLKPTAVVLDRSRSHPYLTDFAIAQRLAGEGGKPPRTGAPTYMAPEQWDGARLTPAVDQFGLAVIAYFLVTGLRPFEAQDNPVVRQRNFRNGPPEAHVEAAANGRADVPDGVSAVLSRALATDPQARFESVVAFTRAFEDALHGRLAAAAPHAFFSYRREASSGWVWAFSSALRDRHGITSFVDVAQMDRAVRFPEKLEHEIRSCDVFVCFLSSGTLQSDWVRREIALARQYGRPMIPVVDDHFVRPDALADDSLVELLEFDFVRLYGDYVEAAIDRLADRIKKTHGAARGATRAAGAKGTGRPS